MSKHNKANRNDYMMSGRLTPDEIARERMRQHEVSGGSRDKARIIGRMSAKPAGLAANRPRTAREE